MRDTAKQTWPPDYKSALMERQKMLLWLRSNEMNLRASRVFYSSRPRLFIKHWGVILEPREASGDVGQITLLPFLPFKRQNELIEFLYRCVKDKEHGLVEKSRDMGATWTCGWFSIWLWLFWEGASIGWGSKGSDEVDQIGNPNSIIEKIRIGIRNIPPEFLPKGFDLGKHMPFMRIQNPETNSVITGDVGDNIGRGGRSLIYFKDEAAHYMHPELVEASLSENAAVQIDLSSVNGPGNVFHRRREAGVDWSPKAIIPKGKVRVFVMDWRDHPAKTQEWYDLRRAKHESEGLTHIFAMEVDRDYSAAVEGTIIPTAWIKSSIDMHIKIGLKEDGLYGAGLDVADGGGDTNAIAIRKGVVLWEVGEWGERDIGVSTRKVVRAVHDICPLDLQYDAVGVGASVKSEYNRLLDEKALPKGLKLVPWSAAAEPLNKDRRLIDGDKNSPLIGDFFGNLKAQGWWELRRRFENSHRLMTEKDFRCDYSNVISISSKIPLLHKLIKELSQATFVQSGKLKMLVDKNPPGTKSPNLADAVVMAFWPANKHKAMLITPGVLEKASLPGRVVIPRGILRRRL